MAAGLRKSGDFCWINIVTPRSEEARGFYGGLLGWTFGEIPGMGHSIQVGGRDIGGLFDLAHPNTPPGTQPVLGLMVKVDSADATAAKAASLGGKAMPPFDVMDRGRMAVLHDPNGAMIDVWEPRQGKGTDVDPMVHGAPSWYETMTTDVERAAKFYAELFGWTHETMPMASGQYTMFKLGDAYVAGMMAITPEMGPLPPFWSAYFTVRDADATQSQAKAMGAAICVPVQDIPGIGRFCGITSPQGITFFVIQYVR